MLLSAAVWLTGFNSGALWHSEYIQFIAGFSDCMGLADSNNKIEDDFTL